MGKEKSKWEVEYNERKAKVDSMIAERDNRINEARREMARLAGNVNSPEYKKFKEQLKRAPQEKKLLEDFKARIPEIDHVIEYRDKLETDLEGLKREQKTRIQLKNTEEHIKENEKKIDELQEKAQETAKKLRNPKLTDEERTQLNQEKDKIRTELASTQKETQQLQDSLESRIEIKRELSGLSQEELETRINQGTEEVKKCNSVAHSLYKGDSWEKIQQKLANWDEPSKNVEKEDKKDRKQHVEEFMDKYNPQELEEEVEEVEKEEVAEELEEDLKSDKPALTFADKHPRLAKIANFFKGIKDKFIKKEKDETKNTESKEPSKKEEKPAKEEKTVAEKVEQMLKNVETKGLDSKFYTKIKEVAEKGYIKAEEDKEVSRKEDLRARLTAFREENGYGPKLGDEKIVFTQKGRDAMNEMYGTVPQVPEKEGDER